jgi:hypothetical protein
MLLKTTVSILVTLCMIFAVCAGCKSKSRSTPLPPGPSVIMNLTNPDGVLGVSHWLPDDIYATDEGAVPAGSLDMAGVWTFVQAGVPWFDSSVVPATGTIISIKLVLEVNAAPVDPIIVKVFDLGINPLTIDPDSSAECEQVFIDACGGSEYGEFTVDSSQSVVEVILDAQAISDLQSAVAGGTGFGIGLRAPAATEANLVNVSFFNTAYLAVELPE